MCENAPLGFRGRSRRALMLASLVCAALVSAALISAADAPAPPATTRAPAAPPAPAPEPKEIVREKTIYVPYEKLQEIFEKEGRGIFLPYEEFLRLWHAAQPKPPVPPPEEAPAAAVIRGGMYTGSVAGDVVRFTVTYEIDALKKGWSDLALPLKGVALESVKLSDPRALFSAKGDAYAIYLPAPGHYESTLQFSVRVTQEPGKKTIAFNVPPIAVSRLELVIPEEAVRVDVRPTLAVTQTTTEEKSTKVLAFLGNSSDVAVSWMPPVGKLADGGAILLASQSIRAYLGERILRIATDISFNVLRGEVGAIRVRAPAETRLLSVKGDNIREWGQEGEVLTVQLHSALKGAGGAAAAEAASTYRLSLTFERILAETPTALTVPFPSVEGVIRESGWVIFGHDSGLAVRVVATTGLSQRDRDEVPEPLREGLGIGFSYLAQPLSLGLQIEKIMPSIRSSATSVVSLGREEDLWIGWVDYEITKAGVFRLEIRVPTRWTVASIGEGTTAEDFQVTEGNDGLKTIAVALKSRAFGAFRLPFRLTAQGSAGQAELTLSPPVVVGTSQDRGIFGVCAPKAFSVTTVDRPKMTNADVDALLRSGIMNQLGADAAMPLTYSYHEPGASVKVRLEPKKTEIDVLAQHLVEITDASIKLTHILDYDILYAAVDRLTFTAPAALDDVLKVEANAKKELRKVSTTNERTLWELLLQSPALGPVSVTINHETELKAPAPGTPFVFAVPLARASDVREKNGFVAIRKEGTLEITPQQSGMEAIDAGDLPDKLRRGQIYGAFRYFTAEPSLALTLTRYDYQALASTVVALMHLKAVLSEERELTVKADLMVQNVERQYLEIKLPEKVEIMSVSVDGKPQKPRQRKDEPATRLIQIPASAGPGGTFPVVIVYKEKLAGGAMKALGSTSFSTPEVLDNVPVTKVELELYLSPEFAYLAWAGTLNPQFADEPGLWYRFKRLLTNAVSAANAPRPRAAGEAAPAARRRPGEAAAAIDIEIPTRGYVSHAFETLAPVGTLSFAYVGRTLYSFIDFLAFVAAFVLGYLLLVRSRWSKAAVALLLIFVPLVLVWFSQGAIVEIFTSILAGGVLFMASALIAGAIRAIAEYRRSRLALAPDPYLEDATDVMKSSPETPAPPPGAPGSPPAASEPPQPGTEPTTGTEPPPPERS